MKRRNEITKFARKLMELRKSILSEVTKLRKTNTTCILSCGPWLQFLYMLTDKEISVCRSQKIRKEPGRVG